MRFDTCPPYFKVESKITRDIVTQCLLHNLYKQCILSKYDKAMCCKHVEKWQEKNGAENS